MNIAVVTAAWVVAGYLAGSIPFGFLVGKMRGVDIRQFGSKNIGATNCARVVGTGWGVLAFACDVAKGFGPVFAAVRLMPEVVDFADPVTRWIATMVAATGPILGHVFPVWLRFRGGKAVATSLGVVFALPMLRWVALSAFGLWVVVFFATRYVAVASSVAVMAFGAGYVALHRGKAWGDWLPVTVFVILLVALVLVRHKSNYKRLLAGTENRFGGKAKSPEERIPLDQPATHLEPMSDTEEAETDQPENAGG